MTSNELTATILDALAAQALADAYRWFPALEHRSDQEKAVHFALGLAGETGEVVEIIKKWNRRPDVPGARASVEAAIGDELVDVLMYLLDMARLLDVDLAAALTAKRARNDTRFLT